MPWCEECSRFFNPTSMGQGGECPTCGRVIGTVERTPWHFKLLVGAASVYLGWRGLQGVSWVVHHIA
jgi:DNA-directed RNA polymerase subunit RPC12/RpoP